MSRHKSQAAIQKENDRAARKVEQERKRAEKARDLLIRTERRERKRKERDERRKRRIEKQRVRESIAMNGVPGPRPEDHYLGFREALACDPFIWCEVGRHFVRESETIGTICAPCKYREEVIRDEGLKSETQGDRPGAGLLTGTAIRPEVPPSGQLRLELLK